MGGAEWRGLKTLHMGRVGLSATVLPLATTISAEARSLPHSKIRRQHLGGAPAGGPRVTDTSFTSTG